MKIIKGDPNPKAEVKTFYELTDLTPNFDNLFSTKQQEKKYEWTLFKSINNQWKQIVGNIKYGEKVSYIFGEKVVKIPFKIEVHELTKNTASQTVRTLVANITVIPKTGKEPQIGRVILLNRNNSNVNEAKFNEVLSAEARTSNLVGREITFYLWEEGASEKDKYKKPKKARVDRNGIAKIQFNLSEYASSGTIMSFFTGDSGASKKFFVSAVYETEVGSNRVGVTVSKEDEPKSKPKEESNIAIAGIEKLTEIVLKGVVAAAEYITSDTTKSPTKVGRTPTSSSGNKCPNCEKDITLAQIKAICVNSRGTCLIEDDEMITSALSYLNKYRKKVGINTCITKAHFLAQISQETKFYDLQERFKYTNASRMNGIFDSYFKQFGRDRMREAERLSALSLQKENWPEVANAIYGKTHSLGSKHTDPNDGWRYSGKGFKQITWKDNYEKLESYANEIFGKSYKWVGGENPYKLKNNSEDAITSALAYWGKKNINSVATEISNPSVRNVTALINPALDGLSERERFFNKAVEVLNVRDCKPKGQVRISNEKGTVVIVSGRGSKIIQSWVVYETLVFKNMSIETYKKLKDKNDLPDADYTLFLSRDAHGDKAKYGKHSDKRYGRANETPPGEYYLIPSVKGQTYKIYVSSDGKSASIKGPDGNRDGVAIHQYSPKYAIGCLTTVSGKDTSIVEAFVKELTDLPLGDGRPVRIIIEERKVKEEKWSDSNVGSKKWTGIL